MNSKPIPYYVAGAISCVVLLVYLPVLSNGFVNWDDYEYVSDNINIRQINLTFFKWAFSSFYAANWHPLTWISHALDYALWGLDPMGHHLTNAVLHALNTFIVVLFAGRLIEIGRRPTGSSSQSAIHVSPFALIAATAAGLLFGLHPLHVESVAWVSERKDLLCALFFLLSVMMYMKYAYNDSGQSGMTNRWYLNRQYISSLVLFMLALMSKPMAVTLPLVLLLLDWYSFKRIRSVGALWSVLIEKAPFFALSLAVSILTVSAQKASGATLPLQAVPFVVRMLVAIKSLIIYLWKMAAPFDLSPFYPYPKGISLLSLTYLAPPVLVIGITAISIYIINKRQLFLSVWAYYVITIIPVLGFVQVGEQAMADRYVYLPSLGPFILLGLFLAWLWTGAAAKKWGPPARIITVIITASVFVSLSYLTLKQIAVWENSTSLWNYVIATEPRLIPFAYNNRGNAHQETGHIKQALEDYTTAVTLDPDQYRAFHNRGIVFMESGELDLAIQDYNSAIAINPNYADAYNNRGITFKKMGRLDQAIEDYTKAITLDPAQYRVYNNRGIVFGETGRLDRAIEDFTRAIALNPLDYALAYNNRGITFSKMGRIDEAVRDYQKACDLGSKEACDALHANTAR